MLPGNRLDRAHRSFVPSACRELAGGLPADLNSWQAVGCLGVFIGVNPWFRGRQRPANAVLAQAT